MFETATFSYAPPAKRVWTTAMGFTGQAVLIGCAVLAPMISPQTLGRALLVTTLVAPGAPPPPPPPGARVVPRPLHAVATQVRQGILTAPVSVPAIVRVIIDDPDEAAGSGPGAGRTVRRRMASLMRASRHQGSSAPVATSRSYSAAAWRLVRVGAESCPRPVRAAWRRSDRTPMWSDRDAGAADQEWPGYRATSSAYR